MKIPRSAAACALFLLFPAYFAGAQILGPQTPLKYGMEGNTLVVKLVEGDSLFVKIHQISRELGLESGLILFNIGQLKNFTLGQYNPASRRYVTTTYKLPWELVSMQGSFVNGFEYGLIVNLKASLADSSGRVIGGHLLKGIVSIANELVILKLNEISLIRTYNVELGTWELAITRK